MKPQTKSWKCLPVCVFYCDYFILISISERCSSHSESDVCRDGSDANWNGPTSNGGNGNSECCDQRPQMEWIRCGCQDSFATRVETAQHSDQQWVVGDYTEQVADLALIEIKSKCNLNSLFIINLNVIWILYLLLFCIELLKLLNWNKSVYWQSMDTAMIKEQSHNNKVEQWAAME